MKIVLIANYVPDRQESMLRYARLLELELRMRGIQVQLVHPKPVLRRWLSERVPLAKWLAYLDKYLLAVPSLRQAVRQADLVHICDHSNSMYLRLCGRTPAIITCHDLLAVFAARGRFSGIHIGRSGRLLQRWIARGLLKAPLVICVSHKTRKDLNELDNGTPPRSTVIHNPLNWDFHPVTREQASAYITARGLSLSDQFFLHIGNNSWYKNRPAAVRIFAALKRLAPFSQAKLVLAGKPWNAELRDAVRSSGYEADIVEVLQPSNEELRALYSSALALLFPSREEGFGWPILEAQACGCPVIINNREPMTEVSGGHAVLIDSENPESSAQVILARYPEFPDLARKGIEHAQTLTIEHAIECYLQAYRQAIEKHGTEDSRS